jgi:hypothetical protein
MNSSILSACPGKIARILTNQVKAGGSGVSRRSALAKSAGRIWINSASDAVVIARRQRRRADRGSTNARAYTHADAAAGVTTAITAAAIDAADASTAMKPTGMNATVESAGVSTATESAAAAASSHSVGRNASDAENCSRGN